MPSVLGPVLRDYTMPVPEHQIHILQILKQAEKPLQKKLHQIQENEDFSLPNSPIPQFISQTKLNDLVCTFTYIYPKERLATWFLISTMEFYVLN